jgi:MoaA/NifB/PqqE/SkfB family radical SAM enzyme
MLMEGFLMTKMSNPEFAQFYSEYVNFYRERGFTLDASKTCPLECPYCPRQIAKFKSKLKTLEDIEIKDYEKLVRFTNKIRLSGQMTDPIYHPKFLEMIKIAKQNSNKSFLVHTNGTRKKLSWWKEVFENSSNNIRYFFALDGTDQETAEIYRVHTRYEELIEVMKLGVSMNVNIVWQFIVFKHNEHQVEEAKRIAKDIGIELLFIKSDRWEDDLMAKYNILPPSDNWITKHPSGYNGYVKSIMIFKP